jgi:alpha-glucosidase
LATTTRGAKRPATDRHRPGSRLLLTLRRTPTLYYGDELRLENVAIPPERLQDPWAQNEPGLGLGRDPARTPMPGEKSDHAGFTADQPWPPLNPDHQTRNVAVLSVCYRPIPLHRLSRTTVRCALNSAEET